MFKNSPLENDVIARLEHDPRIADSAEIAVAGDGGIVTLRGTVERLPQRRAAEHDARGVEGVSNDARASPALRQPYQSQRDL